MPRSNAKGKRGERWVARWLKESMGFVRAHRNHQERDGLDEAPDVSGVSRDGTAWSVEVKYGDHVPKAVHGYIAEARASAEENSLPICVVRRTGERPVVLMDETTFAAMLDQLGVDAGALP